MGSSISAIYDDYNLYKNLCEALNVSPMSIRGDESFYDHEEKLMKENFYIKNYNGYKKLSEKEYKQRESDKVQAVLKEKAVREDGAKICAEKGHDWEYIFMGSICRRCKESETDY